MAKSTKDSPALQLLQLVWDKQGYQMGHSWERLNAAMGAATDLAIAYGFRFDPTDFQAIERRFNVGYWGGNDRHMCGERFYSLACATQACGNCHGPNRSAAIAFETWKQRKPFIVREEPKCPVRRRIAIGAGFRWYGAWVICTSFAEDGKNLTVCSYADPARSKVKSRKRITHDDVKAYHAEIARGLREEKSQNDAEVRP